MPLSRLSGIRYEQDRNDEWVAETVSAIDGALSSSGGKFFFDTSDGDETVINGAHLIDAYGWIVPAEDADDFSEAYLAGEDASDGSLGEEWYHSIIWEDVNGTAVPLVDYPGRRPDESHISTVPYRLQTGPDGRLPERVGIG